MRGRRVGTHVPREDGSTAVEYGLITGAVGIVFILVGPGLWQAFLSLLGVVLDSMGLS